MPYIGNITQDFNVSNAMLDTDSVTSIKIVDGTIEGADIAANLDLSDSQKIRFGTGNDLQIYHDGSNSYISEAGTGGLIIDAPNTIFQDGKKVVVGTGSDVQLYHDGTNSYLQNLTNNFRIESDALRLRSYTGGENFIVANVNGSVELYYDAVKQCETNSTGLNFADDKTASFGTGSDLKIFHASNIDKIESNGGGMHIRQINDGDVHIHAGADSSASNNRLVARSAGAAELYYSGSKKFETWTSGARLPSDNNVLAIGAGDDLRFWHNATNSIIRNATGQLQIQSNDLRLGNYNFTETYLKALENGAVELYYDNSKKFETTTGGGTLTGDWSVSNDFFWFDNGEAVFGSGGDFKIYHNGSHSYIDNSTGSFFVRGDTIKLRGKSADEDMIEAFVNGAVRLYYDNSLKFRTYTGGVIGDQNIWVGTDNYKLLVGGSADLEIFHDGSHSNIKNNTGNLRLQCDAFRLNSADNSENLIKANKDGAVELYHDGTARFQTLSNGCEVLGRLGVGDGTNPETSFQVTATAAGAQYPMLLKNRTNGNAAVGIRFIATGADLSDGDFASIEAGHGAVNSTNHEFRFKTCSGGTVAEKLRIQAGGGISFNGDSAAANALDDYEQGTYTPSLSSGVGGGNISYNSRSGRYTKIGNLVHFTFHMNIASVTLDNGNLKFGGLPFTVEANDSNKAGAAFLIISNGNMPEDCTFRCETNDTQILVISAAGDAVVANTTSLNDGNRQVAMAGFYYTTA